jgi:hypothetical protein
MALAEGSEKREARVHSHKSTAAALMGPRLSGAKSVFGLLIDRHRPGALRLADNPRQSSLGHHRFCYSAE